MMFRVWLGAFAGMLVWAAGTHVTFAQTTATAVEATGATTESLVGKLRQGGYVLYVRHTQTDGATKDGDLSDMNDCSKQRILSKEGQENAAKLGQSFKAVKIPVGTVLTSQFCRAKETAKLMGLENAAASADLNNDSGEPAVTKDESERRAAALRKLLATAPAAGQNTIIIGHVPNLRTAAGLDFANMKEGEFAIFEHKPGDPGYEAIGRVTQDSLSKLAQTASK